MDNIVLLLSGGIDSSTLFALLESQNKNVVPIFIDYGQRNIKQELKSAKYISKTYNKKLNIIKLPLNKITKNLLTDLKSKNPLLPHRNLFFITVASIFAFENNFNIISIAIHQGTNYPDCSQKFIESLEETLQNSIDEKIILYTPFSDIRKEEIVKIGRKLNVPLNKTYSCYIGKEKHCKKCGACRQRFNALKHK